MIISGLRGKRILVTRSVEQAQSFTEKIRARGGVSIEIPLISIQEATHNEHTIISTIQYLHTFTWIIFTSANGVHYFFQYLDKVNYNEDLPNIAVVGKKTKQVLQQYGYEPTLVPKKFVQEDLTAELVSRVDLNDRVLFVRGNLARGVLIEELHRRNIACSDLVVYENVANMEVKSELIRLIQAKDIDVITFTSPSTVNNFVDILENQLNEVSNVLIACIGPITKHAAEQKGLHVTICPETHTIDALMDELESYFS
ncbi:uroporphyrinogen-III synthase [Bacillus sp. HMF5848]|uniref:uroporphyrinogen-III synthase n=1 Tax=Bacillus sp. HMF5848 TaxID=2495421 RepID=UPI000F771584|nr:uroporphyrinogen-III synthase [Bacillus sp. HMF5848]RSK28042.1 uroporphyrinogen-III synthase [Bacillus sp. HMF5848]